MGQPKQRGKKAAKVGASIIASGASAAVTASAGPVAGIVARPLLGAMASTLAEFVADRRTRRANAFAETFMESGTSEITAAAELKAELERSPAEVKDAVVAALRELEEALCDEIVPALGLLTRDYVRSGRGRDSLFIGAARLLRDVASADEYLALQRFVRLVVNHWPGASKGAPLPMCTLRLGAGAVGQTIFWGEQGGGVDWDPDFARPIYLLRVNGLLNELPTQTDDDGDASSAWELFHPVYLKLAEILC
jgi:hypothetical protein